MKVIRKTISICLISLMIISLFSACKQQVNISGEWYAPLIEADGDEGIERQMKWTFFEDGTGKKETVGLKKDLVVEFSYSIADGVITLTFAEEIEPQQSYQLKVSKRTLTFTKESRSIRLTKKSDE